MGVQTDFKYLRQISNVLRNYRELEPHKVNFSCPLCGDSRKAKWKARGYVFVHGDKAFFKCHNCGESKSFGSFLKSLDDSAWRAWRQESRKEEPEYKISLLPRVENVVQKDRYDNWIPLSELPDSHDARLYCASRRIPASRLPLLYYTSHFKSLAEEILPGKGERYPADARLVIPIKDKDGNLIGLSGRSLNGAKIRYANVKAEGTQTLFGVERLDFNKPIFVVEGPIDSLFLPNCVAVCSSNLSLFQKKFPDTKPILIFDNEPHNKELLKIIDKSIEQGATVCSWLDCPFKGKDINDMVLNGASIRDIVSFVLAHSVSGTKAKLKINEWKKGS